MASMKYIKDKGGGFIIFSSGFLHKNIAQALNIEVQAAGHVSMFDGQIKVHGESVSLVRKCDSQDGDAIKRQLDFYDGS